MSCPDLAIRTVEAVVTPRLALVEDDEALSLLLTYNLSSVGFDVIPILSGNDAVSILRTDPPAVVILDWMLPGVSGIEILRRLRACRVTESIAILMLTGRTDPEDRARALATGADAFISKPFAVNEIVAWALAQLTSGRCTNLKKRSTLL